MASVYTDWLESADALRKVATSFEADLRAGLKAELMKLAEERIDALVDETVKGLETKINAMRDSYLMETHVKITIARDARG